LRCILSTKKKDKTRCIDLVPAACERSNSELCNGWIGRLYRRSGTEMLARKKDGSLPDALKGLDRVCAEKKEISEDLRPHSFPASAALLDVVSVSDCF
jgi:hypothetical protein